MVAEILGLFAEEAVTQDVRLVVKMVTSVANVTIDVQHTVRGVLENSELQEIMITENAICALTVTITIQELRTVQHLVL